VVVSCSKWEANSIVLLESMAAGTPWVSFDVGAARANAGGVVVRNLSEMTDAVKELLRNAERRCALGREGRARVAEEHDWEKLTDDYEEAYEAVLEGRLHACP
jgi:glycosyltransferase involved in cell wall biosynthesis